MKAKGFYAVGIGLLAVGIGLIYLSYTLSRAIGEIPEILEVARATEEEAAVYREVIAEVLKEIEAVRLAIPEYIIQAGDLTSSMEKAGQKASEGAVSGLFTGIIKAPISLLSGVGRTVLGNQSLSASDRAIIGKAIRKIVIEGTEGESVDWANPNSGLYGIVTLSEDSLKEEPMCKMIRVVVMQSTREILSGKVRVCPEADGSWSMEAG